MSKSTYQPTAKDVLYALEYLSDLLVMRPGGKWCLKSGAAVSPQVANQVKAHGGVVGVADRSGIAAYGWRAAA